MKQIYYTKKVLFINDEPAHTYTTPYRYAEAEPPYESLEVADWEKIEELLELYGRAEIAHNRKGEITGIRTWGSFGEELYKKKKIQFVQIIEKPVFKDSHSFTFENLQAILPADDFVEWLKDRGITKIM
jgi:hypothetical protein